MSESPQPPDGNTPAPGYYPDGSGTSRFWDGQKWTEHVQGPGHAAAPTTRSSKADRPWFKKKRIMIPAGLVVLGLIGGIGGSGGDSDDKKPAAAAAPASTEKTEDAAEDVAATAETDAETAAADLDKKVKAEAKKVADAAKAKKEKAEAKAKSKAAAKAKAKKAKANTVSVTAGQILKDYEENELAADSKYEGKTIRVTGIIDKIDKEIFGSDYVLMIGDGSEYAFTFVNCNDMSKKALSKLTVGNKVTAIGTFDDGGDLGVELKKCTVA